MRGRSDASPPISRRNLTGQYVFVAHRFRTEQHRTPERCRRGGLECACVLRDAMRESSLRSTGTTRQQQLWSSSRRVEHVSHRLQLCSQLPANISPSTLPCLLLTNRMLALALWDMRIPFNVVKNKIICENGGIYQFSPSHISASTLRSVPARLLTCIRFCLLPYQLLSGYL